LSLVLTPSLLAVVATAVRHQTLVLMAPIHLFQPSLQLVAVVVVSAPLDVLAVLAAVALAALLHQLLLVEQRHPQPRAMRVGQATMVVSVQVAVAVLALLAETVRATLLATEEMVFPRRSLAALSLVAVAVVV
jgi:hypothetical protein